MTEFRDFTIKLLVLDRLMGDGQLVAPHPNAWEWLQASRGVDHAAADDLIYGEYAHRRIPEIEEWAHDQVVTEVQLASIRSLVWDGGIDIFMLLAPSWDGEDDLFDPATWADVTPQRFPGLRSVIYVGEVETHVRDALTSAGVKLEPL